MNKSDFKLDTSGAVPSVMHPGHVLTWDNLSPFMQGYIEAAFQNFRRYDLGYLPLKDIKGDLRFDKLAPETLAATLTDCERRVSLLLDPESAADAEMGPEMGAAFFCNRQAGHWSAFPPVALYLGEDGKIYQKD